MPNTLDLIPEPNKTPLAAPEAGYPPAVPGYSRRPLNLGAGDSDGLLGYWYTFRRHKILLGGCALASMALFAFISRLQSPVYQAQTDLEIQELNAEFLNLKALSPISEASMLAPADIQTQTRILQSRTLLDRALTKLKETWPAADLDLRTAERNLKIRAVGQTRVIEMQFDSTDPKLAAEFVNTLAAEYIESSMDARWQVTQKTSEWLNRQLEDLRGQLDRSEQALQEYARKSGLLFTSDKTSVSDERLRQFQEELSKAEAERVAKQSRYELAGSSPVEAIPENPNSMSLDAMEAKLTDLRQKRAELGITYTEKHKLVRELDAQISILEAALQKQQKTGESRIRNDYQAALRREKLLQERYNSQIRRVSDEAGKAVEYNTLKHQVDSTRQLYDSMLQKAKEAGIAAAMRASNVRILDRADVPLRPYKPNLAVNSALGLIVGLSGAFAFVRLKERANRSLRQPGESTFWLSVPELGVIPNAGGGHKRAEVPAAPPFPLSEPAPSITGAEPAGVQQQALTESFRTVLTSVLLSESNGAPHKVLAITSPNAMEGKTTATSNLGMALAGIGRKVLIIDGDLRKPAIHTTFGLEKDPGIASLLRDPHDSDDALKDALNEVIAGTSVSGLFVLPAGTASSDLSEMIHSESLPRVIEQLKTGFDMILIDTPPMLHVADGRVLGRLADGVILVTRAGHTTIDDAIAARQTLIQDKIALFGTILNDWNPKVGPLA